MDGVYPHSRNYSADQRPLKILLLYILMQRGGIRSRRFVNCYKFNSKFDTPPLNMIQCKIAVHEELSEIKHLCQRFVSAIRL